MESRSTSAFELEFVITGIKASIEFEDGYFDEDKQKDISEYVKSMSKEMCIDKSYVECSNNKHADTFLVETGWDTLRDLLIDSGYGRYLHKESVASLVEAFVVMAKCYLYECVMIKYQDAAEHINISIANAPFDVTICKDTSNSWKSYIGKWQSWNFDDNGNYVPQHKSK